MVETDKQFPEFLARRAGEGMEEYVGILRKPPEIQLSEEEKQEVLRYEKRLISDQEDGDNKIEGLETVWRRKVNSSQFFLEHFLTEEGRKSLVEKLGVEERKVNFTDIEEARAFFYRFDYSGVKSKNLDELTGLSRKHSERVLLEQFTRSGYDLSDEVKNPHKVTVIRNPEEIINKIKGYRRLKGFYKEEIDNLEAEVYELRRNSVANQSEINVANAKLTLARIYKRRLNTLIAELYPTAYRLNLQEEATGNDYGVKENFVSIGIVDNRERVRMKLARLDRFVYGTGGDSQPISDTALEKARQIIEEREAVSEDEPRADKLEKIDIETKVDADEWKKWVEEILRQNDLLSEYQEYSSDREGAAEDGKWQVVILEEVSNISVNSRQRVIKIPSVFSRTIASLSPAGAIPVADHELTHLFQNENMRRIGLQICEDIRTDRVAANMEAGAIMMESEAQQELFGQEREVNPHYLRAIQAKLDGGSYRDCVKAFYDSLLEMNPDTDKEKAIKLAINRATRLFRDGGEFESTDTNLTNSKDLVYLEQDLLAEQLRKIGAERYLFIGGVNVQTLAELHRVGLFDDSQMKYPTERPSEVLRKAGRFERFGIGRE